jgi:succinate dehydrogenase/fumarate reductase flavoprotein subunit
VAHNSWDRVVDVVVVGSGAAALAAAIAAAEGGCQVEVLEKSAFIGGATAFSGGGVWVPMNRHMHDVGIEDSREEALAYTRASCRGGEPSPELLEVYVDRSPEVLDFLESRTPVRFAASRFFSDYYQELPGAKLAGRTLDPRPFESRASLGEWDERIRRGPHYPRLTLDELTGGGDAETDRGGGAGAVGLSTAALALSAERDRRGIRTLGGGLIAALLRGTLDRGVLVRTGMPALRLVLDGDRVTGVVTKQGGTEVAVGASRGVVLAAGGFEWNRELVRTFLGVPELKPASPPTAVGDGLVMGMRVGAALANMTTAWAFPVTWDERSTYEGEPLHSVATPRNFPGCITVNRHGRRFTNEGASYMDFALVHRIFDPVTRSYPNAPPVWAIFDQDARERIELGDLRPGAPTPGWVHEAPTITDLAGAIGVDPDGLVDEVRRFNGHVANGNDPDFGRGTLWFEGFTGGGPRPQQALAPIARPPYFAVAIYDGALGTAGGLRVDGHARVQSTAGGVVPGLYAAGNTAASVFGPGYPSGGATLGPALTFGYLAGRHASEVGSPPR